MRESEGPAVVEGVLGAPAGDGEGAVVVLATATVDGLLGAQLRELGRPVAVAAPQRPRHDHGVTVAALRPTQPVRPLVVVAVVAVVSLLFFYANGREPWYPPPILTSKFPLMITKALFLFFLLVLMPI